MKILNLKRTHVLKTGVYGTLDIEGVPFCQTLELQWRDNATGVSCIPPGEYICKVIMSPKRGYQVYELQNVPNRTNVEIHIGNTVLDIEGCVLLGRAFGPVDTTTVGTLIGVQDSKFAFTRFMAMLANDPEIKLVITEV